MSSKNNLKKTFSKFETFLLKVHVAAWMIKTFSYEEICGSEN